MYGDSITMTATAAAPPSPEPDADPPGHPWRWLILGIVLVAEIMDLLDSTIITIAAPVIRGDLGAGESAMQWWAAGYTLAFGVLLIVGGRLGDVFGRRRMFLLGMAGFTLASAACALAPSSGVLIATRAVQGAFGALLIPQGLGIIKQVFPPKQLGAAFAAFGPVMGLAAIGGPILGGWLAGADLLGTGWRMVFLINLPVGIAGLLLALRFVPESKSPNAIRLDWLGVLLIGAASLALIYPLVQGREAGWPAWTFALLALGVVLLGLFAKVERSGRGTPLIEPSLLRNRAFRGGLLFGIVFFAGFTGMMLVFSVFLQVGLGFSPEHTGLTFAPMSLGAAIGAGGSYPLMAKFGRRVLHSGLVVGVAALTALALIIGAQGADTTSWQLAGPLLAYGIGMGLVFGPFFNVVLAGVDEHEVGSASGTLTAVQQLGGSAGIAVLATLFFSIVDDGTASPDAARTTMLVAAGLLAVSALVAFLLPREARMEEVH